MAGARSMAAGTASSSRSPMSTRGPAGTASSPSPWTSRPRPTPRRPSPRSGRGRVRRSASALVQSVVFLALLAAVLVAILGVALIADVGNIRDMAHDLPKPIPRLVKDYLEWVKSIRG